MRTLSLLLITMSVFAFTAHADSPLRVATYNIRLQIESDDKAGNGWDGRKSAVMSLVRFYGFDVVGFQEVLHGQLVDLQGLDEYAFVGVGRDDGKEAGEHAPIFYRRARFEALASGTFWLSETPEKPSFGWDAKKHRRICTWLHLKDRSSGSTFYVFNVHFDHQAVVARRESAKLLLARVTELGNDPAIVMGDFNSGITSEPYAILSSQLLDTRTLAEIPPYGPAGTFNDFKFGVPPTERIDHIFLSKKWGVLRHGTVDDSFGTRYPSDHFPVFVDIATN